MLIVPLCGCQTSKAIEPVVVHQGCPVEAVATIPPEPKAPDNALVNDEAGIWLGTELLPWARENLRRLNAIKTNCESETK